MDPNEFETVGKYELLREIGSGSMGRVYLARDPFTQREVAVKVVEPKEGASARGERRRRKLFFNEVKAAGVLQHPNIVATIDAGEIDDRRYIAMEYVPEARTLAEFARPETLLPIARVVKIMQECAIAFDYAHTRGVVHRDIKPTNILLDVRGHVKVCDFGVALVDRDDVEETQVVGRVGSPRYMAPEQLMAEIATNQSDIFSLGVVIYELLTGVSPFAGKNVNEIARKIMKEAHTPVVALRSGIPERLSAIVDRTLKKHPAGRYRAAVELAGDLSLIADELEFTDTQRTGPDAVGELEALPAFYGFDPAELAELLTIVAWETREAGERVATEGEGDTSALVIVDGSVVVQTEGVRLTRLERGAAFGDFGLLEGGALGAEIVAEEPSTFIRIGANQAERLSTACRQRLYRMIGAGFAARLQQLQRRVARRARKARDAAS